jgi:hypothetical protein
MYAALAPHPDISFTVTRLCQFNSRSSTSHLTVTKRVLQYLKSTANIRLDFNSCSITNSNDQLTGYSESDWANHSADRQSQGGHVFLLSHGDISWQSRKQDIITISAPKVEYNVGSEVSREVKWLLQLHQHIHGKDTSLRPITSVNQGALGHIRTGIIQARMKHIHVCYYKRRDLRPQKIVDYS